jgi:hypothetical protein
MSVRPDLQARIQAILAEKGPIPAKDIGRYFPGIDRGALDCGLSALMRTNKIGRLLNSYDLVRPSKVVVREIAVATGTTADPLPTVAKEAAASLQPSTKICRSCPIPTPKPLCEFRLTGGTSRADECNACHGKRTKAGQIKAAQIHVTAPVVQRHEPVVAAEKANGAEALKVGHQTVNLASTPLTAGSSPACSTTSIVAPVAELADAGDLKSPPCGFDSHPAHQPAAAILPVIADRVLGKVKTERQDAVDQVARLMAEARRLRAVAVEREADAQKLEPYIAERDHFIELYGKLAGGAG